MRSFVMEFYGNREISALREITNHNHIIMRYPILISILMLVSASRSYSNPASNDSLVLGTWKGTSTCQVKPSPCKDEVNVYHISKGDKPGIYHIVGNKLVNGVEENMGDFDYSFDPADNSLNCYIERYKISIRLVIKGNSLEGTLHSDGKLYRIINLKKAD